MLGCDFLRDDAGTLRVTAENLELIQEPLITLPLSSQEDQGFGHIRNEASNRLLQIVWPSATTAEPSTILDDPIHLWIRRHGHSCAYDLVQHQHRFGGKVNLYRLFLRLPYCT